MISYAVKNRCTADDLERNGSEVISLLASLGCSEEEEQAPTEPVFPASLPELSVS